MTVLTAESLTDPQLPARQIGTCTNDAWLGGFGRVPPPPNKNSGYACECHAGNICSVLQFVDFCHNVAMASIFLISTVFSTLSHLWCSGFFSWWYACPCSFKDLFSCHTYVLLNQSPRKICKFFFGSCIQVDIIHEA